MKKKILVIVDGQYDFIEGGSLAVEGAREAMNHLVEYIRTHYKEYDYIILTADWHPITHCSFKDNGGIWPIHCLQHSYGAALYQPILDILNDLKIDYHILTKGCNEDHEEYSVFKNTASRTYLEALANEIELVDYAGLALNYCVKDSALDGKKVFVGAKTRILKGCTVAIGDASETIKQLEENNVELV